MQAQYWWWLIALALGIAELFTGSLYLLLIALGCAAAGIGAWAGAPLVGQLLVAAGASLGAWLMLGRMRGRQADDPLAGGRDQLLDIGERISVAHWTDTGEAQAIYRGAKWDLTFDPRALADGHRPTPGEYVIKGIVGNRLVVAPAAERSAR